MGAKLKIKKGDRVEVRTGKHKGTRGEVLRVYPKKNRALVHGVNVVKRHARPTARAPGGIIEKEAPIHISNLGVIDPKTDHMTRVGYKSLEDGRKVRYAKRSGEIID